MSSLRQPAVAGQFYPGTSAQLLKQIESFIDKKAKKINALACVLPHAGYIYSGPVAGLTVSQVNVKDKVVLLGPNHTGYGTPLSIMTQGIWRTPLGDAAIDEQLALKILGSSPYFEDDFQAHLYEHSLEVEIPFLQYFNKNLEIVPITIATVNLNQLKEVGKAMGKVLRDLKLIDSVLLVASSDMTHYEPQNSAQKKDGQAIEAILELDEDKLMQRVRQLDISMCGLAPVITMLAAVKEMGARTASLAKYQTSGEVSGDLDSVVGYAGIIIS